MGKRRSEQDQQRIVMAWRRSGVSAESFAAREGISTSSLFRWARAHGREDAAEARSLRLVEAVPSGPPRDDAWAWELATEHGVVRGRDALDAATVRAMVAELVVARAPR